MSSFGRICRSRKIILGYELKVGTNFIYFIGVHCYENVLVKGFMLDYEEKDGIDFDNPEGYVDIEEII